MGESYEWWTGISFQQQYFYRLQVQHDIKQCLLSRFISSKAILMVGTKPGLLRMVYGIHKLLGLIMQILSLQCFKFDVYLAMLLSQSVQVGLELIHMGIDVVNAFLHGSLQEELYLKISANRLLSTWVLFSKLLNKAIYGLKQASRQWFILQQGF